MREVADRRNRFLIVGLLYPLNEFYEKAGLRLPAVERIEGEEIPEPYKRLLVHRDDMTPTLEKFHQQPIRLRMLQHHHQGDVFSRQVLLLLKDGERPVEFGAIKIYLDQFPPRARELILENRRPLGSILSSEHVSHTSHPKAYLRVTSDATISAALRTGESISLYGRRNVLVSSSRKTLAEILEILPPSGDPGIR
jgi:chorismate-pyruvate lyase